MGETFGIRQTHRKNSIFVRQTVSWSIDHDKNCTWRRKKRVMRDRHQQTDRQPTSSIEQASYAERTIFAGGKMNLTTIVNGRWRSSQVKLSDKISLSVMSRASSISIWSNGVFRRLFIYFKFATKSNFTQISCLSQNRQRKQIAMISVYQCEWFNVEEAK